MLASLGHAVSPVGVAELYADFLDVLVLDETDAALAPAVAARGVVPVVAPTIMRDALSREALARTVLAAAAGAGHGAA
jgi:LPPG:FO 2-phospho-L-lactate transferase